MDRNERIAEAVAELKAAALERGHRPTWDCCLSEAAAADLLAREPKTLRNWRTLATGPKYKRIGGRVFYPIIAIAVWWLDNSETE